MVSYAPAELASVAPARARARAGRARGAAAPRARRSGPCCQPLHAGTQTHYYLAILHSTTTRKHYSYMQKHEPFIVAD